MGPPQAIYYEDIDIFGDMIDEYIEKFHRYIYRLLYVCPPELKADYLTARTIAITFSPQRMASEDAAILNAQLAGDSSTALHPVGRGAKRSQQASVLQGISRALQLQQQIGYLAANKHIPHTKVHCEAACSTSSSSYSSSHSTSEASTRTKSLPPYVLECSMRNRAKQEAVRALAYVRHAETLSMFGPSDLIHEQEDKVTRLREYQDIERLIVNGQWLSKERLESLNTFWRQEALASLHLEELSARDLGILQTLYLQKVSRLCGSSRSSLRLKDLLELKHAAQQEGMKETHAAERQQLQKEITTARTRAAAFPWIHRNLLPANWTNEQQQQHLQAMVLAHYKGPEAMQFVRESQQWGHFARSMPSEPFKTVQQRFPSRVLSWPQKLVQVPLGKLLHRLDAVKQSSGDFLCDHVPLLRRGRDHFVDEYLEGVMDRVSEAEAEGGFSSKIQREEVMEGARWVPQGRLSSEDFDRAVQQYWST